MRGRKRLPDHLKVVKGTDQRCRMNPAAPQADSSLPIPPDHLSERAAELFRQVVAILAGMGIASSSDVHSLTILAQRLEEIEICTVVIEDSGRFFTSSVEYDDEGRITSQQIKGHPAVAQRSEAMRHAQSLLAEFGLTPAARSKVSATVTKEENPFAGLG
jgi:P27 family predicted phage terminase small subunit